MTFNIFKEQTLETQKKYANFWGMLFGKAKTMKLLDIDFKKSWWGVFWQIRGKLTILWLTESLNYVFWVFFPILIVMALESGNFYNLSYLVATRIIIIIVCIWPYKYGPEVFQQVTYSVYSSTTKFFLSVDPINHSTRSTGTIISKVQRGKDGVDELLRLFTWEILPIVVGFISIFIIFFSTDIYLGVISLISIGFCSFLAIVSQFINANLTRKLWIEYEDKAKAVAVENLQQMQFIRSNFATIGQLNLQDRITYKAMIASRNTWLAYVFTYNVVLIFYYFSILWIGYILFQNIQSGSMSLAVATGLLGTYFLGSGQILSIGDKVKRFVEKITDIKDLYKFINEFGKQTFPVLESDEILNK